jgi:hypothetical protein
VWLAPSLLIEPRLDVKLPWLAAETAPAALVAGMAFFLMSIWPFWPVLASAVKACSQQISFRWVGAGILELIMLLALAVPFALVAWSVNGREVAAGPLMIAYAAGETMGLAMPRLLEVSPMVGAVRLAVEGWPEGSWRTFAYLEFWPAVGVILVLVGLSESARRRRRGETSEI